MIAPTFRIDQVSDEAILAWRSWRVMEYDTLAERTIRLAACGTRGIPKVWEPRQPVVAVCSAFGVAHEAPWPDHECGIYAYRERQRSDNHLDNFRAHNTTGAIAWARGQVVLWGRVVEHEDGFRAQYAYPYALTVHGPPEMAAAIRSLYQVEVESAEPLPEPEPEPEDDKPSISDELARVRAQIDEFRGKLARGAASVPDPPPPAEPIDIDFEFDRDEALVGLFAALADWRRWRRGSNVSNATKSLVRIRGLDGRPSRRMFAQMQKQLAGAESARLVASGVASWSRSTSWRFTPAGVRHLRSLDLPETIPLRPCGFAEPPTKHVLTRDGLAYIDSPLELGEMFDHEIDARKPGWAAERKEAAAKGRSHYKAWLREFRADSLCRLWYDDEEVADALTVACKKAGGPAAFAAIMDALAPGDYARNEASRVTQALIRLRKRGLARKVGGDEHSWETT